MLLNNIKATGIHIVITLMILILLIYIAEWEQSDNRLIYVVGYMMYILLGFAVLDPTIKMGFLSVSFVSVMLLCVVVWWLGTGEDDIFMLYTLINPAGGMGVFTLFPQLIATDGADGFWQNEGYFLIATMPPSLLMYVGILIKRMVIKSKLH